MYSVVDYTNSFKDKVAPLKKFQMRPRFQKAFRLVDWWYSEYYAGFSKTNSFYSKLGDEWRL